MRIPRLRFTVRRMLMAVAAVALLFGLLVERRQNFRGIAADHASVIKPYAATGWITEAQVMYHDEMRRKYEWAARHPWLLVAPDPSPPLALDEGRSPFDPQPPRTSP